MTPPSLRMPLDDGREKRHEHALVANDELELARSTGIPEHEIPTLARLFVWGDFIYGCSVTKEEGQSHIYSQTAQLKALVGPLVDAALKDRPWLQAQVRLEDDIFAWLQSGLDGTIQIKKLEDLRRSNYYLDATEAGQILRPGQTMWGEDIGTLTSEGFAQTYVDMGLSPQCELYKSRRGKLVEIQVSSKDQRGGRHPKGCRITAIFSFAHSSYPY